MKQQRIVTIDSDLEEIVPGFLENRKKDLLQIQEHLQSSSWAHIESIAHKLAGNAGSYGFNDLGEIGANLEDACQASDIEAIKLYCEQYRDYMESLQVEYK